MEFRLADISAPPGSQMIPEEDRIIIEGGAGHFSTPASLWMKENERRGADVEGLSAEKKVIFFSLKASSNRHEWFSAGAKQGLTTALTSAVLPSCDSAARKLTSH